MRSTLCSASKELLAMETAVKKTQDRFRQRAKQARATACKAWKAGNKPKHAKFSALARAWEIAEYELLEIIIPF